MEFFYWKIQDKVGISTIKPPRWGEGMRTRWPGARGSHWVSSKTSIQFRLQFHSTFSFTNDYPTSANDPTKRAHSYVPKQFRRHNKVQSVPIHYICYVLHCNIILQKAANHISIAVVPSLSSARSLPTSSTPSPPGAA